MDEIAVAPVITVGTCDDFENGLSTNWSVNPTSGFAGTSSATSSPPTNSMTFNGDVVTVTSDVVDTTDIRFSGLSIWVRRGADSCSEDPDGGENLVVEYLNDVGSWIALETFNGAGSPGQIFVRAYTLPAAGRHVNFQVRFRMTGGSGAPWDFWHVDANSIVIEDAVPANTALYVDTGSGDPILFVDGVTSSGLSYNFTTDVTFSNQVGGGAPFTYIPMPDGQGFDPLVTGFRAAPTGTMNGSVGGNDPSFDIIFQVRID